MRISKILLFLLLTVGCTSKPSSNQNKPVPETSKLIRKTVKTRDQIKNINELNSDSSNIFLRGGGVFSIEFKKNQLVYMVTANCYYFYPTKLVGNKVIFLWTYKNDCDSDRGLTQTFGLDSVPIKGKPFGEFERINDSTLHVKYYYPKWVTKINKYTNDVDTLFPTTFKTLNGD